MAVQRGSFTTPHPTKHWTEPVVAKVTERIRKLPHQGEKEAAARRENTVTFKWNNESSGFSHLCGAKVGVQAPPRGVGLKGVDALGLDTI